jgi:hypothetical protein
MAATVDLLFEDYKLKLQYLTAQFDRLWNRFNFFLSVQLAVFGFLGYVTFTLKSPGATPLPIVIGLLVSSLWYIVGAQDRALVEIYRDHARAAAQQFAQHPDGIRNYEQSHPAAEIQAYWKKLDSWYLPAISITRLPALLAIALVVIWLVLLFFWPAFAIRFRS